MNNSIKTDASLQPFALQSRRRFLGNCGLSLGSIGLASLLEREGRSQILQTPTPSSHESEPMSPKRPLLPAKAKNVVFLFMVGAPSQIDMFDPKPLLNKRHGEPIPESLLKGVKFAQITEKQPKLFGSKWIFERYGNCGAPVSELMPWTAQVVDDLTFIKSLRADDVNHAFAELQMNTGWRQFGRPSIGSWVTYGLGSECRDLPGFIVLQSGMIPRSKSANYGNGFLPSAYQGVPFRSSGDPILNLSSPAGFSAARQKQNIEAINELNAIHQSQTHDSEIGTRIAAYEMAFQMQASAPELLDLRGESQATLDMYGVDPAKPSYARNCLLARRLIEKGVRFVQVFHGDWDHHTAIESRLPNMCRDVDRASAALVTDLKSRGLLEDTLVIWGGEFGRGPMAQIDKKASAGRDHQIEAFTMWLAGAGLKPGFTLGATDDFGMNSTEDSSHIYDLQATILHLLGMDHKKLTYRYQGRDFRLTDVYGEVMTKVLA